MGEWGRSVVICVTHREPCTTTTSNMKTLEPNISREIQLSGRSMCGSKFFLWAVRQGHGDLRTFRSKTRLGIKLGTISWSLYILSWKVEAGIKNMKNMKVR